MDEKNENLPIKGLRRSFSRRLTPIEELKEAKASLAYWWYRTLKESAAYRDCCLTGGLGELSTTYQNFGDIFNDYADFDKWWFERGRALFQLKKEPPKVKTIAEYKDYKRASERENVLILEIPLALRKETSLRAVRKFINEAHQALYGDRAVDIFDVADVKIQFNKSKIRTKTIETLLNIHKIKRRHPKAKLLEIAELANIDPDIYVRMEDKTDLTEESKAEDLKRRMTIAASRYIKQAENLIYNAERGVFPYLGNWKSTVT